MKKLMIGIGTILAMASIAIAADYPWELKKNKDGIRVEVRKVEGSAILEYKGTVTVDADLEAVMNLFEDDDRMTEWFHECTEARTVKTVAPVERVLYVAIHMPWPVKDRDVVFRRVRIQDPVTGEVRYWMAAAPEAYPEQKGKVRMPYLKGAWIFKPVGDNRTEITYQQHSEVGGRIPVWLVNKLTVNIPFNSLAKFRELLKKNSG